MTQRFLGESLIFIISQPRTGSTLLQRVLAGNPKVLTSAEPWLMLHPLYALKNKGMEAEYNATNAYNGLHDFLNNYVGGEETYLQGISELARVLYSDALARAGKTIFLDKTPRYYYIIPELFRIFPKAKFIFLVRNPLAVLASVIDLWVGEDATFICKYTNDLLLAPKLIIAGRELLGEKALSVRYEDLVTNPADTLNALCQHLDLDFNPDMLNYGEREVPKGRWGDTVEINKHTAPVKDRLDIWKSMVEKEQTRHFAQEYLKNLGCEVVEKLGYQYADLDQALQAARPLPMSAVIPWKIAIKPEFNWTRKEHLVVDRAISINRYGYFRGLFSYWWVNYPKIIRSWIPR
jgi:hypothetical protein